MKPDVKRNTQNDVTTRNKQRRVKVRNTNKEIRRMASSGMLRRVALVRTDVMEERIVYFIRMTKSVN
jgi:CelD/BcsL family acetyltransferase involved in cellulose biosynthesis